MTTAASALCVRSLHNRRRGGIPIARILLPALALVACEATPPGDARANRVATDEVAQPASLPPLPDGTRVGAYYFGSFSSTDNDPQITRGGCEIYGRANDVWSGVRDFYPGGNRGLLHAEAFRRLKPAIGYYDLHPTGLKPACPPGAGTPSSGECVIYQHIQQAKRYGLSYFSFYWFWDNDAPAPGKQWLNDGLEAFHQVRGRATTYPLAAGFDFYLTIAQMPRDLAQVNEDQGAIAKLVEHMSQDYYLKPLPGRPLLFILDTRATALCAKQLEAGFVSVQEAKHNTEMFIAALRQRAAEASLDPIILLNSELPYAGAVGNADGFSCLHPGGIPPRYSWSNPGPTLAGYSQSIQDFLNRSTASAPLRSVLPCVTAGFDERPREDLVWYLRSRCPNCPPPGTGPYPPNGCSYCPSATTPDIESPRYFEEANSWAARLLYYAESLRQVKYWMSVRPPAADPLGLRRYLTIYAWNEWHEGGILEPAMERRPDGTEVVNEDNLRTTQCELGLSGDVPCP